jgi:hypothetical protein
MSAKYKATCREVAAARDAVDDACMNVLLSMHALAALTDERSVVETDLIDAARNQLAWNLEPARQRAE